MRRRREPDLLPPPLIARLVEGREVIPQLPREEEARRTNAAKFAPHRAASSFVVGSGAGASTFVGWEISSTDVASPNEPTPNPARVPRTAAT